MAVFTSLKIVDLPGQPTIGEACAEWILDFAAAIFGAYDPETGEQLIKNAMLLVSKKNNRTAVNRAETRRKPPFLRGLRPPSCCLA